MTFKSLIRSITGGAFLATLSASGTAETTLPSSKLTPITSQADNISHQNIEASGIVYSRHDNGDYLIVSDETQGQKAALYRMDAAAVLQDALFMDSPYSIDDLESISSNDSQLIVCSSASINKKGTLKNKRRRCFLFEPQAQNLVYKSHFDLLEALIHAKENSTDKTLRHYLKKALKKQMLDIEAHAVLDGNLLLGLKNPLHKGKAVILSLGNVDDLFKGEYPPAFIWRRLNFERHSKHKFRLSDMNFKNPEELLLTTSGENQSALWRYHPRSDVLEKLISFVGAQAEGVSYHPETDKIMVVFDGGNGRGSQAYRYRLP